MQKTSRGTKLKSSFLQCNYTQQNAVNQKMFDDLSKLFAAQSLCREVAVNDDFISLTRDFFHLPATESMHAGLGSLLGKLVNQPSP